MKIIISRKGLDSAAGGGASPIMPGGEMVSLPIPEPRAAGHTPIYRSIMVGDQPLGPIVHDLTNGKINPHDQAHLDPDLDAGSVPRPPGWKPLFGQCGIAERHLQRTGVDKGDLFLFFGWFQQVEQRNGRYRYVPGAPPLHVLFGWLQIERRIDVTQHEQIPLWAVEHPHAQGIRRSKPDSLYISADHLVLPGIEIDAPGAGVFRRFDQNLCLTAPGQTRSIWQLPPWFYPQAYKPALTYHARATRWRRTDEATLLQTVGQGQEFVLDADAYPEAIPWVAQLLSCR